MENIEKLHEEVFNYLAGWSERSRANDSLNPHFYMRSVRDDRFKKGYWFPGNDNYLCISFWAGGDTFNRTPNIFFEINIKSGCRIIITSKDSELKSKYFEKMIKVTNNNSNYPYIPNIKHNQWIKKLSLNFNLWENDLDFFVNYEKKEIDNYIYNKQLIELEEFVSHFGFITSTDFDTMYSRVLEERAKLKESKTKLPRSSLEKNELYFSLKGIDIENFQGIKFAKVEDLRSDAKWIYITGENGYGKTTLLQAIALGLSGDPELEKYLDYKSRISIVLNHRNETVFPVRTKGNISQSEDYDYGQFVLGYGAARLNVQSKSSENMESKYSNSVLSLFENETLLKNINYELFASTHTDSDSESFSELQEIVSTVTDKRISEILIENREALFIEKLSNGDKLEPLPLKNLAAGFRSMINIVCDIYLRLKKTHPNKEYSEFYGIVLIDEIENHLHPILQKELPKTLSKVFPKIQFIISTHSPIPLLAAEKNSIILRVNRTKEDGVTIERLDETIDFSTLLPNTILTSPIFGFQDIFSENKDDEDFVRVEKTFGEVIENNERASQISQHLSKETTDEILKLLRK